MSPIAFPFNILLLVAACVVGVWLLVKVLAGLGWVVGQVFGFLGSLLGRIGAFVSGMVSDSLRIVGGVLTAAFFVPFIVGNIITGRWSRANHYGQALEREAVGVGTAAYRVAIGHAGRLLGLTSLTDGIERRIPEAMARAPGPDSPRRRPDAFEGYTVVGSLPTGGSGARLFLAEPLPEKRVHLSRNGLPMPDKVVIKSFSLADGSTMPQIVRESRALESARKLGLVLEHELNGHRFHYVMPYVPGEDLTLVTQRLHDDGGPEGLAKHQLELAMRFTSDLLTIVQRFHQHGLWHKDIKPSNIIVSDGSVHLVDLGLITPLASAMTLTTHGTEYFRDPELVRLALRGVKVNEVDGVKFDIYGVGAVLYSIIENGFPAHGSLSQIGKRCPEALRWIVRRAMADMGSRYGSAAEMLADLRTVMASRDPYAVKPGALPSVGGDARLVAAVEAETAAEERPLLRLAHDTPRARPAQHDPVGKAAATSRRGGLHWAAVAAGLLAVLTLGILGLSVMSYREAGPVATGGSHDGGTLAFQGGGREAAVLEPNTTPAGKSGYGPPPEWTSTSTGFGRNSDVDPAKLGPRKGALDRGRTEALRRVLPGSALAAHRAEPATLLVLDDVRPQLDEQQRRELDALYDTFEAANFMLLGVHREHDLPAEMETDIQGRVLHVIGQADTWDDELRGRLIELVRGSNGRLHGVLGLDPGQGEGAVRFQLVCPDATDRADLIGLLGGEAEPATGRALHAGDEPAPLEARAAASGAGFVYSIY